MNDSHSASTSEAIRNVQRHGKRRLTILVCLFTAAFGVVAWAAREQFAVWLAPRKQAVSSRSDAVLRADTLFWEVFHAGNYDSIPRAHEALTAAYLQSPADAVTAAHLGFLHIWKVGERARLESVPATITDEWTLARKYFHEAVQLDPHDPRTQGFLAGTTLGEASIHQDEPRLRQGYFALQDAIKAWPEFNLFTAGYVMSRQPFDSPRFLEALEWQWENLCACVDEQVDREHLDWSKYLSLETKEGPKRVCWNSWIAPHNLEGFFLNMGDMLVKSGDVETAREVYANAKVIPGYETWPYRETLDQRIAQAEENVALFRETGHSPARPMMIDSAFSCTACHQK